MVAGQPSFSVAAFWAAWAAHGAAYLAVAAFGTLVGASELISRFRDAPFRLIRSFLAALYCAVNIMASLLTLCLIRDFGWTGGAAATEPAKIWWIQVLTAGIAAMALLRSSLFRVRVGTQDIEVGPAALIQQLLTAIDREIDRKEARLRLQSIDLLQGLPFDQVVMAAPAICAGVLQSLSPEMQAQLRKSIDAIAAGSAIENTRLRLLALELINVAGPELVKDVAQRLRANVAATKSETGGV